jgi:hypothetical protein
VRFGGEVHASRTGALGPIIAGLLFSREYTLADRFNFFRGISDSMRLLWPELLEVDLFKSAADIRVPVLLMEGRNDWEVPSEIAEKYFDSIRAPSKELIWFDRSAHIPYSEERDLFNRAMVAKVLPFAAGMAQHSKTLTSVRRWSDASAWIASPAAVSHLLNLKLTHYLMAGVSFRRIVGATSGGAAFSRSDASRGLCPCRRWR